MDQWLNGSITMVPEVVAVAVGDSKCEYTEYRLYSVGETSSNCYDAILVQYEPSKIRGRAALGGPSTLSSMLTDRRT